MKKATIIGYSILLAIMIFLVSISVYYKNQYNYMRDKYYRITVNSFTFASNSSQYAESKAPLAESSMFTHLHDVIIHLEMGSIALLNIGFDQKGQLITMIYTYQSFIDQMMQEQREHIANNTYDVHNTLITIRHLENDVEAIRKYVINSSITDTKENPYRFSQLCAQLTLPDLEKARAEICNQ